VRRRRETGKKKKEIIAHRARIRLAASKGEN
jgi:hypothetical protein